MLGEECPRFFSFLWSLFFKNFSSILSFFCFCIGFRGDFVRWNLTPGRPDYVAPAHDFFAVYTRNEDPNNRTSKEKKIERRSRRKKRERSRNVYLCLILSLSLSLDNHTKTAAILTAGAPRGISGRHSSYYGTHTSSSSPSSLFFLVLFLSSSFVSSCVDCVSRTRPQTAHCLEADLSCHPAQLPGSSEYLIWL